MACKSMGENRKRNSRSPREMFSTNRTRISTYAAVRREAHEPPQRHHKSRGNGVLF
jgi:hypothetical protein